MNRAPVQRQKDVTKRKEKPVNLVVGMNEVVSSPEATIVRRFAGRIMGVHGLMKKWVSRV